MEVIKEIEQGKYSNREEKNKLQEAHELSKSILSNEVCEGFVILKDNKTKEFFFLNGVMEKKVESQYHLHSNKPNMGDGQDSKVMGGIQMDVVYLITSSMQKRKSYIHLAMDKVKR